MRVQDVMTRAVQTVAPGAAAEDAWELMRLKRIHHLAVIDGPRLAGILSDRDAGGRGGASVRRNRTVADLMTRDVVTAAPSTTVRQAANLMRGRSIGCLVVTDGTRVSGIVTVADLLALLGRGADRGVQSAKRWTLKHRVPRRKQHGAYGAW
jgi:acetoin utilization protein AcuB